MATVVALGKIKRHLILRVDSEEERAVYLVEWPLECRLSLTQMLEGQEFLETIDDAVNCTNCAHYGEKCTPEKPRMLARRIEGVNEV